MERSTEAFWIIIIIIMLIMKMKMMLMIYWQTWVDIFDDMYENRSFVLTQLTVLLLSHRTWTFYLYVHKAPSGLLSLSDSFYLYIHPPHTPPPLVTSMEVMIAGKMLQPRSGSRDSHSLSFSSMKFQASFLATSAAHCYWTADQLTNKPLLCSDTASDLVCF